jgi:hypothetical protein
MTTELEHASAITFIADVATAVNQAEAALN